MNTDASISQLQAFSFDDGRIEDVRIAGDEAWINFVDWRERRFVIHFTNVAFFQTSGVGDTVGGRVRRNSPEIEQVLEAQEFPGVSEERRKLLRERLVQLEILGHGGTTDVVFENCEVKEALPSTGSSRT
ncbi:MAG TPA: hypothetical protein VFV87_10815 [Pirellulaceae bacterium]|nr:hypothetical protein [Pirellulaceae bacterium]